MKRWIGIGLAALALGVAGCGGGGDDDASDGRLTVSVTDAPVGGVAKVVVSFTGVELQPATGETVSFAFDQPRTLDLLTLRGGGSETLIRDRRVPAGRYEWIRLRIGEKDSYVEVDGDAAPRQSLVFSGEDHATVNTGFDVPPGGVADLTVDFDLHRAVTRQKSSDGSYRLRPLLRLVDNARAGRIEGAILDFPSPCDSPAVYVFEGRGVTPDDIDLTGKSDVDVVTTVVVTADGVWHLYAVAAVNAGEYTVAFTCQAAADDPGGDDVLAFDKTAEVTVEAGKTSLVDL